VGPKSQKERGGGTARAGRWEAGSGRWEAGWTDAGRLMEASWADVEAEAADAGRPMEASWADVEAEAADAGEETGPRGRRGRSTGRAAVGLASLLFFLSLFYFLFKQLNSI
jgi:hypothetical protein